MSEDMMCKYSDFFALLPAVGSGCVCMHWVLRVCVCVCWVPAGPYEHPKESCVLECQGMDVLVDTSGGIQTEPLTDSNFYTLMCSPPHSNTCIV